jgi:hypothetical protein
MIVERLKEICERKFPIHLGDVPGFPRDCRIKMARQAGCRVILATQINEQISKRILELKDADAEIIKSEINIILDGYQ